MKLEELTQNIHQWGVDRKIIGNGTLQGQWYKLMSEYGELCDSIAKGKSPIDDIGDIYVVLVMMVGIAECADWRLRPMRTAPGPVFFEARMLGKSLHGISEYGGFQEDHVHVAVSRLALLARLHNLTLEQCVEHAWNEIKDRKGYLNEQGVFVKEES